MSVANVSDDRVPVASLPLSASAISGRVEKSRSIGPAVSTMRDAVAVDDDHPCAGAFVVLGGRLGIERQVVLEVVLVEGGDHRCVVLEVGGDPLSLALGEEHGERDLEEQEGQHSDQQVARQEATGHGVGPDAGTRRNPTARTVSIRSGSSFLRSDAMWTSSVFVEPHQFSSQTSCISCSRPLTPPGSAAR